MAEKKTSELVDDLMKGPSLAEEAAILSILCGRLLSMSPDSQCVEDEVFTRSDHSVDETTLHGLMLYIFNRRFAWKDKPQHSLAKKEATQAEIISLLDQFIQWFKSQDLSIPLLQGYIYAVEKTCQNALVRKQTFNLATEWLKLELVEEVSSQHFPLIKEFLLVGIQDIWSAIRNLVVSRLSTFVEMCSLLQLQDFFMQLVKVCQSPESLWQAKEGAIMAVNTIVRRFQWVGVEPGDIDTIEEDQTQSPRTQYFLKFGSEELAGLPAFITGEIKATVYLLLAHPQLTVREHATKAFSSYLARCEFKEALSSFKDIIDQLCKDVPASCKLPHLAYLYPEYKAMDAYQAEGLLGVCVCLVKHIPPGFMLPNWPRYFSAFCLYLAHPASTVRQTASNIFKFLVAKDSHNPLTLKLVLQGLSCDWPVDRDVLAAHYNKAVSPSRTSPPEHNGVDGALNGQPKPRISILHIATSQDGQQLSESWEWREGRLLAYEVIFQFLVKNHIIYTFGSLNSTVQASDGGGSLPQPGSSVDETMFPRGKKWRGQDLNAHSFSEASTRQALRRSHSDKHHRHSIGYKRQTSAQKGEVSVSNNCSASESHNTLNDEGKPPHKTSHPRYSISVSNPSHQIQLHQYSDRNSIACGPGDSPNSKLLSRLPTVAGLSSPSLKTLVKHYSYFTQGSQPFAAPSSLFMGKAASLLMHSLALHVNQNVSSSRSPREVKVTKSRSDKDTLRSCLCPSPIGESDSDGWLDNLELSSVGSLLHTTMCQTIECLADTQWELRRMGQQLLPCVVEVMRWYDMSLLEDLWNTHLQPKTSLMTYGACLALQYSLEHAAGLLPMLQDPPDTWQDGEFCRQIVLRITGPLTTRESHLSHWLSNVLGLLGRPCYDKLTVTAMHVLMLANTHLNLPISMSALNVSMVVSVVEFVFIHAHPDSSLAKHLQERQAPNLFNTPLEGFLSCVLLKANGVQSCAKQVEKYMLNELSPCLPGFLGRCEAVQVLDLLPILALYISQYTHMDTYHKHLLDSVSLLINKCVEASQDSYLTSDEMVKVKCTLALKELVHAVTVKSIELTVLKSLLEMCASLCTFLNDVDNFKLLLKAIYSRISNVTSDAGPSAVSPSGVNSGVSHLVPVVSITQQESQSSETDDELDPDVKSEGLAESQMLNLSCISSNSRTSRASVDLRGPGLRSSISEDDPDAFDWDSWDDDDEEEELATSRSMLSELLQKLDQSSPLLRKALHKLGSKEQKLLEALLN